MVSSKYGPSTDRACEQRHTRNAPAATLQRVFAAGNEGFDDQRARGVAISERLDAAQATAWVITVHRAHSHATAGGQCRLSPPPDTAMSGERQHCSLTTAESGQLKPCVFQQVPEGEPRAVTRIACSGLPREPHFSRSSAAGSGVIVTAKTASARRPRKRAPRPRFRVGRSATKNRAVPISG
jgi:hypothetical protein